MLGSSSVSVEDYLTPQYVYHLPGPHMLTSQVTLALTLTGDLDPLRAVLLFITQISGACFAAYLDSVIFPSPFNIQTTLGAGTTVAQGVWIEALCTAELVFTIIMLAKEKHRATFVAPVGIGLALFIAELVAVYYTGGSLNPARSFGPAAVAHDFISHHWIYWVRWISACSGLFPINEDPGVRDGKSGSGWGCRE